MQSVRNRVHRARAFGSAALALAGLGAATAAPAQDLFVSCYDNTIRRITPNGTISTFVASGALHAPEGLAFDAGGNLYVTNVLTSTISKVTPGGTVSTFASGGSLDAPVGLAFDASDTLYTANSANRPVSMGLGTLSKIASDGTVSFLASGGGLNHPSGLAIDRNGNLYTANANDTISKITPGGTVSLFASGGSLHVPVGLAFDPSGNLYAANVSTISRITPNGTVSLFAYAGALDADLLGLTADANGNLYAAGFRNQTGDTIFKIAPDGTVSTLISGLPSAPLFLAFGPASTVPGPGALPIFASGLAASAIFLRKRGSKVSQTPYPK